MKRETMRSIFLFLILFFSIANLEAQDKKLVHLFEKQQYCECVERYKDIKSKKRTTEMRFINASSYYQLFKKHDLNCLAKEPLSKCLASLFPLKKARNDTALKDISNLFHDVISSATEAYREDMKKGKWNAAFLMIERLKDIEITSTFIIDQALCEYKLSKPSALETTLSALRMFADYNTDNEYFINQTNNILQLLDSTMNENFVILMDTVYRILPDNDMLANTFYNHWKRDIKNCIINEDYDSLVPVIKKVYRHYPSKKDWKDEMNNLVHALADSLVQNFLDNDENIASLIACCSFLMNVRLSLNEIVQNLNDFKYYRIPNMGKNIQIPSYSVSTGVTIKLKFSFLNLHKNNIEIVFNSAVPGTIIQNIKGNFWKDAPESKRAKAAKDIVKQESMNYYLLDSLSHFYCNKFRIENNKKPLVWNNEIYRAASKHHSKTMAGMGCLMHGERRDSIYGQIDLINAYLNIYSDYRGCSGENCLYAYIWIFRA